MQCVLTPKTVLTQKTVSHFVQLFPTSIQQIWAKSATALIVSRVVDTLLSIPVTGHSVGIDIYLCLTYLESQVQYVYI